MIIRTVKQRGDFAVLPKAPLNDKSMSWEARGMLSYLLEKPDGWEISLANLVRSGPAEEYKVRRILGELKNAGYVRRIRIRIEGGTFRWITQIYETPQSVVSPHSENHYMVDESDQPHSDYPHVDEPHVDEPHVDEPHVDEPHVDNREIYQYPLQQEESEVILNQKQEQQQQHASPVEADPGSGVAAAAVSFSPEQRAALALLGIAAPGFTAPETFVRRYDPRLIGLWAISVNGMTNEELASIKSIPAFIYSMVKAGAPPSMTGRGLAKWDRLVEEESDNAPEELGY
jgi:hypothetical protein